MAARLLITSAKFGLDGVPQSAVDVTAAVQKAAGKFAVSLAVSLAALGLSEDPFPGKTKRLFVEYSLGGVPGRAAASERRTLKINVK